MRRFGRHSQPVIRQHGRLPGRKRESSDLVRRDSRWPLITAAQRHVYIQSPFFILDESLMVALQGAARAGVEVKIMLAPTGPDGGFAYRTGVTYAENIAAALH